MSTTSIPAFTLPLGRPWWRPAADAARQLAAALRRMHDAHRARVRERAELAQLLEFDDRMLRDLGLARGDLPRVVRLSPLQRLEADAAAWRAWSVPLHPRLPGQQP